MRFFDGLGGFFRELGKLTEGVLQIDNNYGTLTAHTLAGDVRLTLERVDYLGNPSLPEKVTIQLDTEEARHLAAWLHSQVGD